MASQVLSGSSNVSYTNNTGENVRLVINYMQSPTSMNWTNGGSITSSLNAIGRNLALFNSSGTANNAIGITTSSALPTELMLAPTHTFSANCGSYNIVVIP